jgi:mono/diheme cytochrome c family protein
MSRIGGGRRARIGSAALLLSAVLSAVVGCSDAGRDRGLPRPTALPPEVAGAPASPDHPAGDLARASATDLAREPSDVDWGGGNPERGRALFATRCSICHGSGGTGDGIASPAINPKPRDFTTGRFYIDASANGKTGEDVDLARVILYGPAAFGGTRAMTPWRDALSDDDVRDLIAFIRTLATPKPPR